ncbi:hypothetical protein ABR737_24060 [Streptomyces sp. Edi2]|uniref:hypothetical protein n=1 Tax=Streptomyces sp. Edi2 TaxID=3162528 RepID=UPI00330657B5
MPLLDWRDGKHFDPHQDLPCVLCGGPTPMRSHDREPVHKVCAETWNEQADAPRYLIKVGEHLRDVGTHRFHDDTPNQPTKAPTAQAKRDRPAHDPFPLSA